MFSNAKVGDKVWHIVYGWGNVKRFCEQEVTVMEVLFKSINIAMAFTLEGKEYMRALNPTLFWNEVKIEHPYPKKPFNLEEEYRKLETKKFELQGTTIGINYEHSSDEWNYFYCESTEVFGSMYFQWTDEVAEFVKLLNEHKITPKQLNEVVRKVEREDD